MFELTVPDLYKTITFADPEVPGAPFWFHISHFHAVLWEKYYKNNTMQWRIQDFPESGAPTPKVGAPTYYFDFFSKTIKFSKNWTERRVRVPTIPLDLPMNGLASLTFRAGYPSGKSWIRHWIILSKLDLTANTQSGRGVSQWLQGNLWERTKSIH